MIKQYQIIKLHLSIKCAGTIGDPKPARTSPYDGTELVILLRPEDMRTPKSPTAHARSYRFGNSILFVYNDGKIKMHTIRQVIY